jgi:type VI secretion system protein ImpL
MPFARLIVRVLFNRWVPITIGLMAIGLVIWWVGPTISINDVRPLEEAWARWLQIALLLMIPAIKWGWGIVRARRATAALTKGMLEPGPPRPEAKPDPPAEDVARLRQRFEQALGLLRRRRFGAEKPSMWARARSLGSRQHLYDLPWYVFIGAPGAGKTTALVNSGLRFPLADRLGREAVRGVGGTRDCDWWFTDEAVFLDTAGRYTTQDSNRELDAGAWKGFLQLLKKSRPRRPINGVLVTVSVDDLLRQSPAELESHAQALRARVQELYAELGARFPIYVLVTKSDLLAGFSEFFASLGREERAQAWGLSLPLGDQDLDPSALSAELERLERRLFERLPERLEAERDPARRALAYGFPEQFALLRDRLVAFVDTTFGPTKFQVVPLLRGVYFTSGTQEGSPIDRVMGALARELGMERQLLPAQRPNGRSYFLTRLLREVVFPEAGLAGLDLRWERRRRWLHCGAIGAAAAVLVLVTAAWWVSYAHNHEYLGEVAAQFAEVKKQADGFRRAPGSDLAALLPILGRVDDLAKTRDGAPPWSWRLGLYQGSKLAAASEAAYQPMLQDPFLSSLAAYLERYLGQDSAASPEESYEALRTYVMLYDPQHFKRDAVWRWYQAHLAGLMPGAEAAASKALKAHFDALYEGRWVKPAVPPNDALIARKREMLGRDSLPARIYELLKGEPLPDARDFTLIEKAGPKAMSVFERASREPLTKGVPGLYTKDGYYKHVYQWVERVSAELADEESWVLGTGDGTAAGATGGPKVAEAVKRLYLQDYRRIWRRFIDDIAVLRGSDLIGTIEITQAISAQDSPLKRLVKAIDRETKLSVPPEAPAEKAQEPGDKARQATDGGSPGSLEKILVDDHFEDVARFATSPGGNAPAPMDTSIGLLNEFYQWLSAAKTKLDERSTTIPPDDAVVRLRAEFGRQPMARAMLKGLTEAGARQVDKWLKEHQAAIAREDKEKQDKAKQAEQEQQDKAKQEEKDRQDRAKQEEKDRQDKAKQAERQRQIDEARQKREQVDAELRTHVADSCVKAITGRYPFVKTSAQDVTPDDFARLFAPGGVLDAFFQKHLVTQVDTSQKPWRFRDPTVGQSASLAEFQRAQVIRDVFFRGGGAAPSIQFEFKPLGMDASIHQFILDVDGKLVRYAHGPQVPVKMQFPGPAGRGLVRVSISPPSPSGASGVKFDGPWALFRMFDGAQIEETKQSERFVATIAVEGRRAEFEVVASSVRNPFRLPELSQFRCPTQL